ncbi:TIGR00730 family Rossman fold protein [Lactobacillus sp. YT155]|uniref:LOG family protein n=1 Tax=Lactobacillus sp. YT155 TaxID=3060955 RepID=UPI00265E7640|nr:TIGR00730 family Rossman fold protein [Lactobacillus sp. YT155]MDO1605703.1 TIGR00730 family Rossman fold protein [Lactobacillus sp. YT155]
MPKIAIFCGASTGFDSKYIDKTKELGQWMVRNNYDLVYGGGNRGLMGVIADSVLDAGGKVYGFIPQFLVDDEQAHPGLTSLEIVDNMDQRKQKMMAMADACLALPGGPGTIEEISEAYSWQRVGQNDSPTIIFNQDSYYKHLQEMYDQMVELGFLTQQHRDLLLFSDDFNEIDQFIRDYKKS